MVVIRPGDHVWLTYEGDKKLEVAIGVQIKKAEGGKILGWFSMLSLANQQETRDRKSLKSR